MPSSAPSTVWSGTVALVTGASSGIGEEVAVQLAAAGARVALVARRADALDAIAARIAAAGGTALPFATDVTDADAVHAAVAATVDRFGRLDTLVANAGLSMHAPFAAYDTPASLAAFETLVRVNYLGSVHATHAALPHLLAARGRLVAVASLAALTGVPMRTGYSASKAAQTAFFESLRVELAGTGVSVTVAHPGFVATPLRRLDADGAVLPPDVVERRAAMPVETCARLVLAAAAARRREVVMTAKGRAGRWLKLVAPALVDRIAARTVERGR